MIQANTQIKYGKGYDHNFVLNTKGNINEKAAEVTGDKSGIIMDIYTMEPGIQFYGGNFMDASHNIKGGKQDDLRTAFCLETQHYPDSPNQPAFPSTELKPGQQYKLQRCMHFRWTAKQHLAGSYNLLFDCLCHRFRFRFYMELFINMCNVRIDG